MSDEAVTAQIVKKPLISEETSKRITSLRYFLILFVVFGHNLLMPSVFEGSEIVMNESAAVGWLKLLISESLSRGVVLVFFLFAAFLQYKKNDPYPVMMKKKVKGLLIPMIIWPVLNLGYICAKIVLTKWIPAIQVFPGEKTFFTWDWKGWVNCFIGYGNYAGFPLIFQFWFIRDLFVISIFTPIIKYFVKKFPLELLLLLLAIYFLDIQTVYMSNRTALFYVLGFIFAEYDIDFFKIVDKFKWKLLIPIFLAVWVYRWTNGRSSSVSEQVMGFVAVFLILKLSKIFIENEKVFAVTKYLGGVSFFLYSIHGLVLLTNTQMYWILAFPMKNSFWCLMEYFCVTAIVVGIGTGLGIFLRRFCNPMFALLNGGRG